MSIGYRLGVTEHSHREKAQKFAAGVRGVFIWVWVINALAIAGWFCHVAGLIPPAHIQYPPEGFLKSVGLITSPGDGNGTGFMIDESRFLTTRSALGANVKVNDAVKIRFRNDSGGIGQAEFSGAVKWISPDRPDGVYLVIVAMAEPRLDFVSFSSDPFLEREPCCATGYLPSLQGILDLKTEFLSVTSPQGILQANWPPNSIHSIAYEGLPIACTMIGNYPVKGILTQDSTVVPLAKDDLGGP